MTQPTAKQIKEAVNLLKDKDFNEWIKPHMTPEDRAKLDFVLWHNKRYPNHWFKVVYKL